MMDCEMLARRQPDNVDGDDGVMEQELTITNNNSLEEMCQKVKDLNIDDDHQSYAAKYVKFLTVFSMTPLDTTLEKKFFGPWENNLKQKFKDDMSALADLKSVDEMHKQLDAIKHKHFKKQEHFQKLDKSFTELKNFVMFGLERYQHDEEADKTDAVQRFDNLVSTIIKEGHGEKLVYFLERLTPFSRNFSCYKALVRLLALLSVCKDDKWAMSAKKNALKMVPIVCDKPLKLFYFLHCHQELLEHQEMLEPSDDQHSPATKGKTKKKSKYRGWDQHFRRAVAGFYTDRTRCPQQLLLLCTKYKQRYGWSHRKVLNKCHVKIHGTSNVAVRTKRRVKLRTEATPSDSDSARNLVLCYLARGMKGVQKQLEKLGELQNKTREIQNCIEVLHKLRNEKANEDGVKNVIQTFGKYQKSSGVKNGGEAGFYVVREHVNTKFLAKKEVWEALLRFSMLPFAMIHNLGIMTLKKLFDEKEQSCLENIECVTTTLEGPLDMNPLKLLIAYKYYASGRGDTTNKRRNRNNHKHNKRNKWTPNHEIQTALEKAVKESFKKSTNNLSTERNLLILVSTRSSVHANTFLGCPSLKASEGVAFCVYTLWCANKSGAAGCKVYKWPSDNRADGTLYDGVVMKENQEISEVFNLFKQNDDNVNGESVIIKALNEHPNKDGFIVFADCLPSNYQGIKKALTDHDSKRRKKKKLKETRLVICCEGQKSYVKPEDSRILAVSHIDLGALVSFLALQMNPVDEN